MVLLNSACQRHGVATSIYGERGRWSKEPGIRYNLALGEVAEWLKAPLSKSGIPLRVSWVRIPPSPPHLRALQRVRLSQGRGVTIPAARQLTWVTLIEPFNGRGAGVAEQARLEIA